MQSSRILRDLRARSLRGTAFALLVVALVAALAAPVAPLAPALAQGGDHQVVVGDLVAGTLDSTTYVQFYQLPASAGDIISIEVSADNDALEPALVLLDPTGNQVAEDSDATSAATAMLADIELTITGSYTILVLRGSGAADDATGTFTMRISGIQQVGGQTVALTQGGITFDLAWSAAVNLNLEVRDPVGGTVHAFSPGSPSGGTLDADVNGTCAAAISDNPTETIGWPIGNVPAGSYEIIIYYQDACAVGGPQLFNLSVTVDNGDTQTLSGTVNPGQTYLARMLLQPTGSWALQNGGINAGLDINLFSDEIANSEQLALGSSIFNTITNNRPAQAFTFTGTAGSTVSIAQTAQSGSLDTYLVLIGPDNLPLASNDDVDDTTTNSAIESTLAADGTYTILATRYGLTIGGTEGEYTLSLAATTAEAAVATADTTAIDATATAEAANALPNGVIEVQLNWLTNADLQLLVRDPSGTSVFDDDDQIPSGGTLFENGNARCEDTTDTPVSYIYWPNQLQPGTYEIEVWYQNSCDDNRNVAFALEVNVLDQEVFNVDVANIAQNGRYMATFTVAQDLSATQGDAGFFDMSNPNTLDFTSQLPFAQPLTYGMQIPGTITADQPFQVYAFEGELGDAIQIAMTSTGSTLDPALFLVYQEGTSAPLTIASNDDVQPNVNANSLIEVDGLPQTGTYYIIATHYGLNLGGTFGTYNLALAQQ